MITISLTTIIILFLLAVFLGAVLTLSGAALGALVVFRTKREPHEPLFKIGTPKGEAFTLDDFPEEASGETGKREKEKEDPYDPFPPVIRKAHERMAVQMAKEKMAE